MQLVLLDPANDNARKKFDIGSEDFNLGEVPGAGNGTFCRGALQSDDSRRSPPSLWTW